MMKYDAIRQNEIENNKEIAASCFSASARVPEFPPGAVDMNNSHNVNDMPQMTDQSISLLRSHFSLKLLFVRQSRVKQVLLHQITFSLCKKP